MATLTLNPLNSPNKRSRVLRDDDEEEELELKRKRNPLLQSVGSLPWDIKKYNESSDEGRNCSKNIYIKIFRLFANQKQNTSNTLTKYHQKNTNFKCSQKKNKLNVDTTQPKKCQNEIGCKIPKRA